MTQHLQSGRPVIDTIKYGLKKPGARTGSKSCKLNQDESIEAIWKSITGEILEQGFPLATSIEAVPHLKF